MADFKEDQELLETFDAFVEVLREKLSVPKTHILNPVRLKELQDAYLAISKIVLDISPDAKIDCELNKLTPTQAAIVVETDEIVVKDIKLFISGINGANNFEVYPLTNGKIKMAIMFHKIMQEI